MAGIEFATIRATKGKREAPKEKYVNQILRSTWSEDGTFQTFCTTLATRVLAPEPAISLKAILILHLVISRGPIDKAFTYLASHYRPVELYPLIQRPDFPIYICRYAKYLDARLSNFASLHNDIIKCKSDKTIEPSKGRRLAYLPVDEGLLIETESLDKLMDTLIEALNAFDDLQEDALIEMSVRYLLHDLFKLVEAVSEGIMNSLQRFFTLSQADSIRTLKLFDHHRTELTKLQRYFDLAKSRGQGTEVPDIRLPAESLMSSLRDYVHGVGKPITLQAPPLGRRRSSNPPPDALTTPVPRIQSCSPGLISTNGLGVAMTPSAQFAMESGGFTTAMAF